MKPLTITRLPQEMVRKLKGRGVSGGDFSYSKEEIDLHEALVKYTSEIPRVAPKTVGGAKQYKVLEKVMENPLRGHYVIGISSFPSDQLAKQLAISIMAKATLAWHKKHKPGTSTPLWHRVMGGLGDPLRDIKPGVVAEKPSMLIISNINENSTPHKLEKVRDLLERYSECPRIVVMSGTDPLTFFGTKLYYPVNAGIYLGPPNRMTEV